MAQRLVRTRVRRPVADTALSATWEDAADSFEVDCRSRKLSPATIALYREVIVGERVTTFRTENGVARVSQFSGALFRKFQVELIEAKAADATVTCWHKTLKTFLHYCEREKLGVDESAFEVRGPQLSIKEPDTFTEAECTRLLRSCTGRDRVIVELLLRTGLRREELITLTVDDLMVPPTGGGFLRIRGKEMPGRDAFTPKMRKDRLVPLDSPRHKMSLVLQKHIVATRALRGAHKEIFLTRSGQPMTAQAVKSMLQRLGDDVGVHCHAHKFRHTFATQAIADGVDVFLLQRVLGHSNLEMVRRYVHFDNVSITAAWAKRGAA